MSLGSAPSKSQNLDQGGDDFWTALFAQEQNLSSVDRQETPPSPTQETLSEQPSQQNNGHKPTHQSPKVTDPWQLARQHMEADQVLHLQVTNYNKGGLIVYWHGIQGFVPASQLLDFPQFHIEQQRLEALREWMHRRLKLKIIEVNPHSNRLILSERASQVKAEKREELLAKIGPGDKLTGIVSNLTEFGAFLDLGGVEGLIHISELSWSRVTHPSKVLQPGETANVLVLDVDRQNGRVALSRKRLHPNPWHEVESRYQPGQIVEGVVSNVVSFGAFVMLERELEGLIHISELAEGNFLHPRNVVQRGQHVRARVLSVNGRKKRLALSLRAVPNEP